MTTFDAIYDEFRCDEVGVGGIGFDGLGSEVVRKEKDCSEGQTNKTVKGGRRRPRRYLNARNQLSHETDTDKACYIRELSLGLFIGMKHY